MVGVVLFRSYRMFSETIISTVTAAERGIRVFASARVFIRLDSVSKVVKLYP